MEHKTADFGRLVGAVRGVKSNGPILLANPAAVIWTALVAQEGASNANGEGPCRGSRPFCKLGHLAIQLGFANSIRSFDDTGH